MARSADEDTAKDTDKDAGRTRSSAETSKGLGGRGRDLRHGPEGKGEGVRPNQGLGAGRQHRGKGWKGRRRPPGTGRAGRGGKGKWAGRRARDGERGASAARRPAGEVHPPRYPADAGAPRPPTPRPPRPPLRHRPRRGGPSPPQSPRPPYQPAPHPHSGAPRGPAPAAREPEAEPARMASAPAARGSGAAPAPQAQEPQAEPARGAEGARGD